MYKLMIRGLADTTDVSKDTYMYEKGSTKRTCDSLCHHVLVVRGPSGMTTVSKDTYLYEKRPIDESY